jgi:hypothetical protein
MTVAFWKRRECGDRGEPGVGGKEGVVCKARDLRDHIPRDRAWERLRKRGASPKSQGEESLESVTASDGCGGAS